MDIKGKLPFFSVDNLQSIINLQQMDVLRISLQLKIDSIQLDDQRMHAKYPVVIQNNKKPVLDVEFSIISSDSWTYFQHFTLRTTPIDVMISEGFIKKIVDMVQRNDSKTKGLSKGKDSKSEIEVIAGIQSGRLLFFREFFIATLQANLSVHLSGSSSNNTFELPSFIRFLIRAAISLQNTPLMLAGFKLDNSLHSKDSLGLNIGRFYAEEFKRKVFNLFVEGNVKRLLSVFISQVEKKRRKALIPPLEWKDAKKGEVPSNAMLGGNDEDGNPFYIGRAYHFGGLYPGQVSVKAGGCVICVDKKLFLLKEYEVLVCDPKHIKWRTFQEDQKPPKKPIEVGHEQNGQPLWVAKLEYQNQTVLGKAGIHINGMKALYKQNETHFAKCQVLTWKSVHH